MALRKKKKNRIVTFHVYDIIVPCESQPVAKIVRHYRRTGGFRRKDLRLVLGNPSMGVSAGKEGLDELLAHDSSGTR